MSYFEDHYQDLRYPLQINTQRGFRHAQLGAIHSIGAHFVTRNDPAIITMPTGSGKTSVLIASAFVLRAKRVLIITPSRLVREQIAKEVSGLQKLKELGALATDIPPPNVLNVKKRITSLEQWQPMQNYDVIVATPASISPEYEQIPEPPHDLFDLIIVDEAHHSPARTWSSLLRHFQRARHILLTATPFRHDQREVKGRFTFTYELRQAYSDGIFG
jgi:superfamily II DNA or RNA helicase